MIDIDSLSKELENKDNIEYWQIATIERLIETSTMKNENIDINELTFEEANILINKLRETQLNPIKSGLNYNQTDIINEIKKLM